MDAASILIMKNGPAPITDDVMKTRYRAISIWLKLGYMTWCINALAAESGTIQDRLSFWAGAVKLGLDAFELTRVDVDEWIET